MSAILEPVQRLERDIKKAAATLGPKEARFLVDDFYALQDFRIQSNNQVRSILKSDEDEPHAMLAYLAEQYKYLEKVAQGALDVYSNSQPLGQWAREHIGVGPVIAAGLLAHIDIEKAPYASSIHRFAGLLPGQKKVKGQKRDWNADLKVLCWKLGDSFVKLYNHERCYYGHLYRERKELEVKRDQNGYNAITAKKTLEEKNIQDKATRATYESGHLPDGRLDQRARRYAVKRFLTAYFEAAWVMHYNTEPPDPWIVEHGGHRPEHIQPNPFVPRPVIIKGKR
jgi:hypothetical protein